METGSGVFTPIEYVGDGTISVGTKVGGATTAQGVGGIGVAVKPKNVKLPSSNSNKTASGIA